MKRRSRDRREARRAIRRAIENQGDRSMIEGALAAFALSRFIEARVLARVATFHPNPETNRTEATL